MNQPTDTEKLSPTVCAYFNAMSDAAIEISKSKPVQNMTGPEALKYFAALCYNYGHQKPSQEY